MTLGSRAERLGHTAHASDWLDHAVRIGLVAYGLVHLMIAWVAVQLAFGDRSGAASSSGALHALARQPFGEVLLWLIGLGLFLLVPWRLMEAALGHRDEDGLKRTLTRLGSAGMALVYGWIGFSAVKTAMGDGSQQRSDSVTARLMDLPAGQLLVGLVGLGIIGVGVGLLVVAWSGKLDEHLDAEGRSGDSGTAYLLFGRIGHTAKGAAIAIVGGLFGYAALTHEANKSGGLDQALHQVREQPYGQVLLVAVALGIACYGLFCFARARHLSR